VGGGADEGGGEALRDQRSPTTKHGGTVNEWIQLTSELASRAAQAREAEARLRDLEQRLRQAVCAPVRPRRFDHWSNGRGAVCAGAATCSAAVLALS
jgi:transcription elongation GreA/GreB family factor